MLMDFILYLQHRYVPRLNEMIANHFIRKYVVCVSVTLAQPSLKGWPETEVPVCPPSQ